MARGFLSRLFCAKELGAAGWNQPIVSDQPYPIPLDGGTVRGVHFQRPPHAEMKLVSCIRGKVWDVAVDVARRFQRLSCSGTPSACPPRTDAPLLIPEGFCPRPFNRWADDVELLYCHSAAYAAAAEAGSQCKKTRCWRLPGRCRLTELSARDAQHPMLNEQFRRSGVVKCRHCATPLAHTFLDLGFAPTFQRLSDGR